MGRSHREVIGVGEEKERERGKEMDKESKAKKGQ